MRSIEMSLTFPLSSVKPLERLLAYRAHCLGATRHALLAGSTLHRTHSPIGGAPLEAIGDVEGFAYARCPETGSLFLATLAEPTAWAKLLTEVSEYRHSPEAFHVGLAQSRTDHVYAPKLEWIQDTMRLQEMGRPSILELVTRPSPFTQLLQDSGSFGEVVSVEEMELIHQPKTLRQQVQVAVLLESLDRVDDPSALLRQVANRLVAGGLLFVTSLVSSGFDMAVLGMQNRYLYPPDRTNCFSLQGLSQLLEQHGFTLLEVSTPGVLDVEIVRAHLEHDPALPLSPFERQLLNADGDTHGAFQSFLQQRSLSSFARMVGKKRS